jgi:hypothetical protein
MGTLATEISFLFQFSVIPDPWRKIPIQTILCTAAADAVGRAAVLCVFFCEWKTGEKLCVRSIK